VSSSPVAVQLVSGLTEYFPSHAPITARAPIISALLRLLHKEEAVVPPHPSTEAVLLPMTRLLAQV
jgi:hypothetical protein